MNAFKLNLDAFIKFRNKEKNPFPLTAAGSFKPSPILSVRDDLCFTNDLFC